ncbi:MAG: HAD-IA family hydrolase [Burkholderiales bacterium]
MSVAALLFDVDGTLADTEEAHRLAFNDAFDRLGIGWNWTPDVYRGLLDVTGGKQRIAAWIAATVTGAAERARLTGMIPAIHEVKTQRYNALVGGGAVSLREGVQRLMEEARSAGCLLAIASTTTPANVDALLRATLGSRGIGMFGTIACGDEVTRKKPAPDIYELALVRLGVAPEDAVAFEDSRNGLLAAHGAGLWTVVTPNVWTASQDLSDADLLLPHLGDPGRPLPGEPGTALEEAAWLTYVELARRKACRPRTERAMESA